jgi:hypothetical protein
MVRRGAAVRNSRSRIAGRRSRGNRATAPSVIAGRGREQVHGAQPDARRALEHGLDERSRQALAAVVGVHGHAAQQAVRAVELEPGHPDDAAVVLADYEVVAPALAHVLVGEFRAAQEVERAAQIVGPGRLGAQHHGCILPPLRARPKRPSSPSSSCG